MQCNATYEMQCYACFHNFSKNDEKSNLASDIINPQPPLLNRQNHQLLHTP